MKIKFRYKDADGVHYLKPVKYNGDFVMVDEKGKNFFVDEDELDILAGYDSDDKEVYEGDILTCKDNHKWTAELLPQAEMTCGGVYENLYNPKCGFKLKERGENEKTPQVAE